MPTPTEAEVLQILSSIEISPTAAKVIEQMGNDAISLTCDIASGAVPGLRNKVRTNAAALLGFMGNQQAKETVRLLISDANMDVAIRAMRAAGRMKLNEAIDEIATNLKKSELDPLLAAEAVKALLAIDSSAARKAVQAYSQSKPADLPHRNTPLVISILSSGPE